MGYLFRVDNATRYCTYVTTWTIEPKAETITVVGVVVVRATRRVDITNIVRVALIRRALPPVRSTTDGLITYA